MAIYTYSRQLVSATHTVIVIWEIRPITFITISPGYAGEGRRGVNADIAQKQHQEICEKWHDLKARAVVWFRHT